MASLYDFMPDPCQRKHGGNPESEAAFAKAAPAMPAARSGCLEFIRLQGERGATSKEIAYHFSKGLNAVSGRCSELRQLGLVRPNGQMRDGCAVLIAVR